MVLARLITPGLLPDQDRPEKSRLDAPLARLTLSGDGMAAEDRFDDLLPGPGSGMTIRPAWVKDTLSRSD